jgi:hypothetical protein
MSEDPEDGSERREEEEDSADGTTHAEGDDAGADAPEGAEPFDESALEDVGADDSDPFAELDDGDDDSDPFAELDDAPLGERTPATDDDLFEEMNREELTDEDTVVESVLDGEDPSEALTAPVEAEDPEVDPSVGDGEAAIDGAATAADADSEVTEPERDEVVVPKRRYCEGCQYFSSPPETACEHPGTDILELADADHFRVADCPVVEWRRELEAYPDPGETRNDPRQ